MTHTRRGVIVPHRAWPVKRGKDAPTLANARPLHFLVSMPPATREVRANLGAPAYSYAFVFDALRPALEQLGICTLIDRPESRLAWHAQRARQNEQTPLHLAIAPLQDATLHPDIPNILFPFWEFPKIPNRDFDFDTRQNWARIANAADLILTACTFTAQSFRNADVRTPVAVVPIPVPERAFETLPWSPHILETIECRHVELNRWRDPQQQTTPNHAPKSPKTRSRQIARAAFQRLAPAIGARNLGRIARARDACRGKSPAQALLIGTRFAYKRTLKAWLSDQAINSIHTSQRRLLTRFGMPSATLDPEIPTSTLSLQGLVYTTFLSIGDPRKNPSDLLSAFLLAFQNNRDATLVIKLATSPRRAFHELGVLNQLYESFKIRHRCRVVAIADFLTDDQLDQLNRATTFYLNTSHAEGACLPLMEALAAGRPAIAPRHSAMADYLDDSLAFVVDSDLEPCPWPHDPDQKLETLRHRLRWDSLKDQLMRSRDVALQRSLTYSMMAHAAQSRMRDHYNAHCAAHALNSALSIILQGEASRLRPQPTTPA